MTSFIEDVIVDLYQKGLNIPQLIFVLPSRRAGVFLKHQLSKHSTQTFFAPEIVSIEEFVETLSDLHYITNTELIFEFYEVYLKLTDKENQESFDEVSKWAQMLIQDFNEIDRYLIPPAKIFDYLSAIKEIEHQHWSLDENPSTFVKNYLLFWNQLKHYYNTLQTQLLEQNKGYQGLVYRKAVDNLEQFTSDHPNNKYIFMGFNALNKAEETIIQELLQQDLAHIYWDIDETFIQNREHDAGLFIRQHKATWPYLKQHPFNWLHHHYTKPKNIKVTGVPKNVSQIKYIGELLLKLDSESLKKTAIVLGNEELLLPLLNSIPKSIGAVNITMGLPLKSVPLVALFDQLLKLHIKGGDNFYYKDALAVLSNQFVRPLLNEAKIKVADVISTIEENNIIYLNLDKLITLFEGEYNTVLSLLFGPWKDNPNRALENCFKLISLLKSYLDQDKPSNMLALEYLYRFNALFNELSLLNSEHKHIKTIATLYSFYKELLSTETLDFQGEPLEGLQIMGMLETRALDFESLIIASVNEGILPAGKSHNSFIPYDVKLENKLPTYKEKDAVYTYHFYRLLQRATNAHILYNTEIDALNSGEKSRFITQLEIEGIHPIQHKVVTPKVPKITKQLKTIKKTDAVLEQIKRLSNAGFSPSSLTNYIRNPMDFYTQKILGVKTYEDVEESIAANTLGTVIHNTLEDLYKPHIGEFLKPEDLEGMKPKIDAWVKKHFKETYKEGDISTGKNLIIFEVAKRYVWNTINLELNELRLGNEIKIIALEKGFRTLLDIPELDFPVYLTGKVDRIDEYNGITRIIDYKSGKVDQSKVEVVEWEDLTTDYDKYSKSFQVLTYALMMHSVPEMKTENLEAGIISFKNLNAGFLKFAKKDKPGAYAKKDQLITSETLENFSEVLKNLILEICNPDIDFIEREV
ncbi:PD-(D/E)XK nuclease family protein [Mangrovimonas xylaniphaga]|uniref:PD-(D/E)XK nuclease family protein n=1 Tax=Mangrovimonas xylaniphaga TaxID=1645915 RepID=UPI0006B5199D|nr:PD-(D/E)XK nuclease family protein [Mangrovimonas xylaniphaga]